MVVCAITGNISTVATKPFGNILLKQRGGPDNIVSAGIVDRPQQ
jgi:hypothetical protein